MSGISPEVTPLSPAEAATEWFARRRNGLRAHDEDKFAQWLGASPENRTAYDEVTRAWEWSGAAAGDPAIVAMRSQALMLRPERRPFRPLWGGLAAAVLMSVGGAGFYVASHHATRNPVSVAAIAPRILQTAIGERATTTLEDGSIVTLDTNSRVRILFTPGRRDVALLTGQALFQVAKNKSRPFVVTAGDRQVTAVGTEFQVRLDRSGAVRVALLEGRVNVQRIGAAPGSTRSAGPSAPSFATLAPGELLLANTAGTVSVRSVDLTNAVSWREGRVRFEETPLADAVAEMNRYSIVPIVITDPRIRGLKISGAFRTGQSEAFVAAIGEVFAVRGDVTPDGIKLHASG